MGGVVGAVKETSPQCSHANGLLVRSVLFFIPLAAATKDGMNPCPESTFRVHNVEEKYKNRHITQKVVFNMLLIRLSRSSFRRASGPPSYQFTKAALLDHV